jgi:hypothetical protein
MIIFQTAGCGCANGIKLGHGLLDAAEVSATTFRTNDYIHRLNRALQAEMRALSAYSSLVAGGADQASLDAGVTIHHGAGRELVRLIIANRGVPEERAALSFGLTRRLITFCNLVPTRLSEQVSFSTLRQLERLLLSHYQKLLTLAPPRDQEPIKQLLAKTQEQVLLLQRHR